MAATVGCTPMVVSAYAHFIAWCKGVDAREPFEVEEEKEEGTTEDKHPGAGAGRWSRRGSRDSGSGSRRNSRSHEEHEGLVQLLAVGRGVIPVTRPAKAQKSPSASGPTSKAAIDDGCHHHTHSEEFERGRHTLEQELSVAVSKAALLKEELTQSGKQLQHQEEELQRLKAELAVAKHRNIHGQPEPELKNEDLVLRAETAEGRVRQLELQLAAHSATSSMTSSLQAKLEALEQQQGHKEQQIQELQKALDVLRSTEAAKDQKISELETGFSALQAAETMKDTQIRELEKILGNFHTDSAEKDARTHDMSAALAEATGILAEKDQQLEQQRAAAAAAAMEAAVRESTLREERDTALHRAAQAESVAFSQGQERGSLAEKEIQVLRQQLAAVEERAARAEASLSQAEGQLQEMRQFHGSSPRAGSERLATLASENQLLRNQLASMWLQISDTTRKVGTEQARLVEDIRTRPVVAARSLVLPAAGSWTPGTVTSMTPRLPVTSLTGPPTVVLPGATLMAQPVSVVVGVPAPTVQSSSQAPKRLSM